MIFLVLVVLCCAGAPPEGAELEWLIPEFGHTNGDERIVIKGTKMTCRKSCTFTIIYHNTQGSNKHRLYTSINCKKCAIS